MPAKEHEQHIWKNGICKRCKLGNGCEVHVYSMADGRCSCRDGICPEAPKRTEYVVGLAFSRDRRRVVLIEKKTGPACVIGNWNGVGGKIEPGETPLEAMAREFREETGANSTVEDWKQFATLIADDYDLHFFVSDTIGLSQVGTVEDERVHIWGCIDVLQFRRLMPNMRWMIPYLMDMEIDHNLGTLRVRR